MGSALAKSLTPLDSKTGELWAQLVQDANAVILARGMSISYICSSLQGQRYSTSAGIQGISEMTVVAVRYAPW